MKHVLIFLVFVAVVVGLLFTISDNKAPRIPENEEHRVFDDEKLCWDCHGPDGDAPRKETHPPKDQCLVCHGVKDNRREQAGPGSDSAWLTPAKEVRLPRNSG